MFYVERLRRHNKKDLTLLHVGPPLLVLFAFLGITVWSWLDARQSLAQTQSARLSNNIEETKTNITDRLNAYENILRAGAGLFENSNQVERDDWKNFVDIFDIEERYPGIQGIGYAEEFPAQQLLQHEQRYRDTTYPKYSVYPDENKDSYTSIVFLEPKNQNNDKAIGYDMTTESKKSDAMKQAKDSGEITLTEPVTLIQDKGSDDQSGFLIYVPVYKSANYSRLNASLNKSIEGYVFASFRSEELIGTVTNDNNYAGYGFRIYNNMSVDTNLLYESSDFQTISTKGDSTKLVMPIAMNDKTWLIEGVLDPTDIITTDSNRPIVILWLGVFFSIILALLIYILLVNRTKEIANKEAAEIQNAKDELLALASHQLRTPATGVKQYLGMLQEGYAGALNKDQRKYIKKAYESNERQLNTINQMLFVARSDAGKIKLTVRHLDIAGLTKDILDELKNMFAEKHHKLKINIPDHSVDLFGDEQYLRMALENILSNAIKYTEEKGKITISIIPAGNNVKIVVEDTGVGVNQEDLPLLFKKFSRVPNELTSKVAGSGIGLYLTRSIVKAHGGTISFESVLNTGSSVTIILPSKLPKNTEHL